MSRAINRARWWAAATRVSIFESAPEGASPPGGDESDMLPYGEAAPEVTGDAPRGEG
jgi:hypothetical protein